MATNGLAAWRREGGLSLQSFQVELSQSVVFVLTFLFKPNQRFGAGCRSYGHFKMLEPRNALCAAC